MVRIFSPLNHLHDQGKIQLMARWEIFQADVAIFHRHWKKDSLELMKECQRRGITCLVDYDDDLFNLATGNPSFHEYQDDDLRKAILAILRQADKVLCSTPNLAWKVMRSKGNAVVVPNGIDLALWQPAKPISDRFIIGWAGSVSHKGDFDHLHGFFYKLYEKFGDRILFRFLGYTPDFLSSELPPQAYESYPWVSVHEYPAAMKNLHLDLAILPLADNEFNRAKSNLKWLEMSSLCIPCLASRVGPYKDSIDDGETGVVVRNRMKDWLDAAERLILMDSDRRREIAMAAASKVALHYSLQVVTETLLTEIQASREDFLKRRIGGVVEEKTVGGSILPKPVTVIIPVYNAMELTRACVESVLSQGLDDPTVRVQLIDDASTQPGLGDWLDSLVVPGKIGVYRFHTNQGFVQACNMGMQLAGSDDVVLLNSDAVLAPLALQRLREAATSDSKIGTVTAVTNSGEIAEVPSFPDTPEVLQDCDLEPFDIPTAVGHCMYIKREVLDRFGPFDRMYGRGYGEENDFSFRIREEYRNVLAPKAFVWHHGHASFGDTRLSPERQANQKLLEKRYPSYGFEVHCHYHSSPIWKVRQHVFSKTKSTLPRLLHVGHSYFAPGGTEKHMQDLTIGLKDDFFSLVAAPNQNGTLNTIHYNTIWDGQVYLPVNWPITPTTTPRFEEAWKKILDQFQPDLIHIHHLLHHPLGTLDFLLHAGVPVLVSLHDHFFLCPDPHIPNCPGVTKCEDCFHSHFKGAGPVEYQWHRRQLLDMGLRQARQVISPSNYIRDAYQSIYQDLPISVLPLGVQIPKQACSIVAADKLKFCILGHFVENKGSYLLLPALDKLVRKYPDVEFHIHGHFPVRNPEDLPKAIIPHGQYQPGQTPDLSTYHAGIVASQVPESYCLTLSEMQAYGLPVVVSNTGALPERVDHDRTGWVVDNYASSQAWFEQLDRILSDRSWLGHVVAETSTITSMSQMLSNYRDLYQDVLAHPVRPASSGNPFTILS